MMDKFDSLLSHNAEKSAMAAGISTFLNAFSCIRETVKKKNLSQLKDKSVALIVFDILLVSAICVCLWELSSPAIWLILFAVLYAIEMNLSVNVLNKYKRYDPEHRVFRSENHTYGDNKFMSPKDEQEVFELSKDINTYTGMILGIDSRGYMASRRQDLDYGNLNALVAGNSGTRKGTGVVVPRSLQMIQSGKSGVIASTKDDNYALISNIARCNGYDVKAITLRPGDELEHSDSINLLKIINGRTDIAQTVAHCIIENTSPGERVDYWFRGERHLLYAILIMCSLRNETLTDVYKMLAEGLEYIEAIFDLLPKEHPAYEPYMTFKVGDRRPQEQVLQGLGFRFSSFMAEPNIQKIVSYDDVDFDMIDKQKCLYFIIVSDKTDVYKALSSTLFSLLFFSLGRQAEKNGGSLKNPVEIIIDEAFAVGAIPGYSELMATSRGYGINIMTIVQSLPQLQEMYPTSFRSILNDCGIKILVHTDDPMTAEYFSEICGTFTAESESKDKVDDKSGAREVSVPLMSTSDIFGMDIEKQLVYISGVNSPTIILKKQMWYADWPGSTQKFYNQKDGKTYNGHPLLKDFRYEPLIKHTPKWKIEETNKQKSEEKIIRETRQNPKGKIQKVQLRKITKL